MCTFGLSGYRVKDGGPKRTDRRGSHTTARELQTCTFQGPGASNTTKIPRKDPQENERRKKTVAGEGKKKREILGPPPFGAPPFGPTLRGPGAPLFLGLGFHPSGLPPFGGPTLCGPKIQHSKIGRSRNWPKSVALRGSRPWTTQIARLGFLWVVHASRGHNSTKRPPEREHLKKSELEPQYQKYKCRVVLRGDRERKNKKNETGAGEGEKTRNFGLSVLQALHPPGLTHPSGPRFLLDTKPFFIGILQTLIFAGQNSKKKKHKEFA